ncbi:MAG TPA: polyphosphate kinase 1 [Gaiellaceae bacterium]
MSTTTVHAKQRERLLNRELSWLEFNARVLELASDEALPLLERVKFLAIFSSNLDEFFMVRVAGLMDQSASGLNVRSPDGRLPDETLAAIRTRVRELVAEQSRIWNRELRPALDAEGIHLRRVSECDADETAELTRRFDAEVYPMLTPLAVGPGQRFPYISGLSLSLGVFVRDPESGEERFARVKVPEALPRFMHLPKRDYLVPLEAVIAHHLTALFPQMEIAETAAFRVTRDADFSVSDEADDLLEAVELELSRRRFGDVVRLEVSESMSERMLDRLIEGLDIASDEVFRIQGLLDLADLTELTALDHPDLKDEPWVPRTPPAFLPQESHDLFKTIASGSRLVQHPYDSFETTFEAFLDAAAEDRQVTALKTTVYRTSDESPIVPALIAAAESGKQTVCLVELKARFDESKNIAWSRALERAGVHVVYGFPNLKIHAKMTMVVRREGFGLKRYVHIGTGNYHARNARLYEDFGLFTADDEIAADVADLFNYITGFGRPLQFRKLLVAPFDLRDRLIAEIRAVAQAAAAGKPAWIGIKVNSLTDEKIVNELYRASEEGAHIDVVARSICTLRPGVHGLSENIAVRSVVGRFLEHSRVFVFQAGKKVSYFMGSADLMPRNLDYRLEVVAPVEDPVLQQRLRSVFDVLLADNSSAWELDGDGAWHRLRPKKDEPDRSTHRVLMKSARPRARRRAAALRRAR